MGGPEGPAEMETLFFGALVSVIAILEKVAPSIALAIF